MPYLGCTACHHELEGDEGEKCDWCGEETRVLEERTPLEKLCEDPDKIIDILKEIIPYNEKKDCPFCGGQGSTLNSYTHRKCDDCKGTGKRI